MKAERLAKLRVADEARYPMMDAAVTFEPQKLRRDPGHAPEIEEGHVGQIHVAFLKDGLRVLEKPCIAVNVCGTLAGNLGVGELGIVTVLEAVTVLPTKAIKGINGHELEVIGQAAPRKREQLFQGVRCGDHRRASIESKALILIYVGSPAGTVPLLENRGLEAGGLQPDRQRQAAEPATDNHRSRSRHTRLPGTRLAAVFLSLGDAPDAKTARNACPGGTGGAPMSSRSRSVHVDRPA